MDECILDEDPTDLQRPFRMPWVPALPMLSAAVSLTLMLGLPRATQSPHEILPQSWL